MYALFHAELQVEQPFPGYPDGEDGEAGDQVLVCVTGFQMMERLSIERLVEHHAVDMGEGETDVPHVTADTLEVEEWSMMTRLRIISPATSGMSCSRVASCRGSPSRASDCRHSRRGCRSQDHDGSAIRPACQYRVGL